MSSGFNCILTPVGSGGDVYPYIGLGRRLRARGHDVALIGAEPFRRAVEDAGLQFVSPWTAEDYDRTTRDPDLWHPRRGIRLIFEIVTSFTPKAYHTLADLYQPGRTILVGHTLAFATRTFEETHKVPAVTIHLAPNAFRSAYAQPVAPNGTDLSNAPVWVKRAFWWAIDRFFIDPPLAPALNEWRATLGLPPITRVFKSWLHSPQRVIGFFPEWFGPPQPDWPSQLRLVGFPLQDGEERPLDPAVEHFLSASDPPIVFTPGTANRHARHFFQAGITAAAHLGRRVLLVTAYPEHLPANLPPGVHHAPFAPFSRLFPRAAAVVHHGGVGTCAQGLAAGVPQLVMPMGFDQPDNAARLARLGVGAWLPPQRFTADRVAAALAGLLSSPDVAQACRRYRDVQQETDALGQACDLIEQVGKTRSTTGSASHGDRTG